MLAHLSDLHVLAPRTHPLDWATRIVSLGRSLDPEPRRLRVLRAFESARLAGATHFVVTGDLTETGTMAQFQALAEVLHEVQVPADRIVLVPGNHDAYTSGAAWRRALHGPLAPFKRAAAEEAGKVVECGDLLVLPINTSVYQRIPRSSGLLTEADARRLRSCLADPALRGRRVMLAMHHSPLPHPSRAWQWVDGLRGYDPLVELLHRFDNIDVLHGHLHYDVENPLAPGGRARIFGMTATVEDPDGASRLRIHRTHEEAPDKTIRAAA